MALPGASAGTAYIKILPNMTGFTAATQTGLAGLGTRLSSIGTKLTKGVTLPVIGAGIASAKMAADFQASMQQIVGLVGISQKQVDKWSGQILDLAKVLPQSPQELAEAMFFVTSAGFKGSAALDVLNQSARAAAAGLGETMSVADAVTSAVNAYGIENLSAADAVDTLTATVKLGKAEAASIAPILGGILPTASELGVSFQDVGAAIAAMTRTGDSAASAATKTNAIFSSLTKVTTAQEKAFKKAGLSAKDLRESMAEKGLLTTLQKVRDATGGNIAVLAEMFPNVRALRGVMSLTGSQADKNAKIFRDMANATGTADAAFESASGTVSFKWKTALSSLQVTAIKFGNILLPIAADIAEWIGKVADKFGSLSDSTKKFVVIALGVAAAIGPILFIAGKLLATFTPFGRMVYLAAIGAGLLAKNWDKAKAVLMPVVDVLRNVVEYLTGTSVVAQLLKTTVLTLTGAFVAYKAILLGIAIVTKTWAAIQTVVAVVTNAWAIAQFALNLALTANPIGVIVVAIAALVAVLIVAWKNSETFRNIVIGTWNAIKTAAAAAFNFVKDAVGSVVDFIAGHWRLIIAAVGGPIGIAVALVTKYWDQIVDATKAAWEFIYRDIVVPLGKAWGYIKPVLGFIAKIFVAQFKAIYAVVSSMVKQVVAVIKVALKILMPIVRFGLNAIVAIFKPILKVMVAAVKGAWNVMKIVVKTGMAIIKNTVVPVFKVLRAVVSTVAKFIAEAWSRSWAALGIIFDKIRNGVNRVKAVFTSIVDTVRNVVSRVASVGKGMFDWIVQAARSAINGAISVINAGISAINRFSIHIHIDPPGPGAINFDWGGPGIPTIPTLAQGGIATAATLAIVGEAGPEAIVPLDEYNGRKGGRQVVDIYDSNLGLVMEGVLRDAEDQDGRSARMRR